MVGHILLALVLLLLPSSLQGFWNNKPAAETREENVAPPPLECELYLAESTIPGAGYGLFSGVEKHEGDFIGNGDKAIPLIDAYWHNGFKHDFFNPTADYVWDGVSMGMRLELFDATDVSAFWPGIDAMVNCHFGLLNLQKATPVYDEGGVHRSRHHWAGSISPYEAYEAGSSFVTRDIPPGGELFKSYGDNWFLYRDWLGKIPLKPSYDEALSLLQQVKNGCENDLDNRIHPSTMYKELIQPIKKIWDSRTLNALYDFEWEDIQVALEHEDIGVLLQPNATRSIDWLNENGKCLDHIVHQRSTIDGAGAGAFAKRYLPKGTTITGTPLLVFPDERWFDMYNFQDCPDGNTARNTTGGPYGKQLLLNYCFGHPESSMVLCPLGSGVNYINHNQTRANVKIQWAKHGDMGHGDFFFKKDPQDINDYSTRVAFDYIATRDIAEGEELFLDYGDLWEEEFQKLGRAWQTYDRSHLDSYVSATEYNNLYPTDPLYTTEELQEFNPHPDNLHLRCHYLLNEYRDEAGVFAYQGDVEDLGNNWMEWTGDNTGVECEVLLRVDEGASYIVRYKWPNQEAEEGFEIRTISNVPRQAIKFFDDPYTTDIHMYGSFRQAIGMPDDMLPKAWRRTAAEKLKRDDEDLADNACPRNPSSRNYYEEYYGTDSRVRYTQSNVRGSHGKR